MKLYIKQKVFSWKDKFHIYDEYQSEKYYAESELISFGKKLHIFDNNENELCYIYQKVLSFLPRYFINIQGTDVAEVVKSISFFKPKYEINGIGWSVSGDFFAHDYVIENEIGVPIATISKKWLSWGDAYEIDIPDPNNEIMVLAIVLIIDAVIMQQNSN